MAIQTVSEIVSFLITDLGDTAVSLTPDQQVRAANTALTELGWTLPTTTDVQDMWVQRRALRHAIFLLSVDSARKFKYGNINLDQRFTHYQALVVMMDNEFGKAVNEDVVQLFNNLSPSSLFGDIIPAGFCYTTFGEEISRHK